MQPVNSSFTNLDGIIAQIKSIKKKRYLDIFPEQE